MTNNVKTLAKDAKANVTGEAKDELSADMTQLKADFGSLRDDMRSMLGSLGSVAKARSEQGLERGSELADQAGEKARESRDFIETQVRSKPLTALGLAAGAGFLIAAFSRR